MPDNQWVFFWQKNKIRKIVLAMRTLCAVPPFLFVSGALIDYLCLGRNVNKIWTWLAAVSNELVYLYCILWIESYFSNFIWPAIWLWNQMCNTVMMWVLKILHDVSMFNALPFYAVFVFSWFFSYVDSSFKACWIQEIKIVEEPKDC